MSYQDRDLAALVAEIQKASANIQAGDAAMNGRIDAIEASVNDLFRKLGRPALSYFGGDDGDERKDAIGLCYTKHELTVPKVDGAAPSYTPGSGEIDEALRCKKAITQLFRTGELNNLDVTARKSLSSFSLGGSNFILSPQMSSRVLRCIVEPFNLASFVHNETISAGSIKYPLDNSRMNIAGWACDASCFANNPSVDLAEGLGELEIKAEPLRFVACAGSDLLQDAAMNVEMWLMNRVSRGFEQAISTAILIGNGLGMPQGLLHPSAGVPICDTAAATAAGSFTWQDVVMLAYEVPVQWHDGAIYLMNQRTLALCLTMSDAAGRPLLLPTPLTEAGRPAGARFSIAGFPVVVCNIMPDVMPGATPILFGNLEQTYTVVWRRATTMTPDPYTAGFCTLFRFEARVGGAATCSNASRLLRIR